MIFIIKIVPLNLIVLYEYVIKVVSREYRNLNLIVFSSIRDNTRFIINVKRGKNRRKDYKIRDHET
jgi:hypothetical protein